MFEVSVPIICFFDYTNSRSSLTVELNSTRYFRYWISALSSLKDLKELTIDRELSTRLKLTQCPSHMYIMSSVMMIQIYGF